MQANFTGHGHTRAFPITVTLFSLTLVATVAMLITLACSGGDAVALSPEEQERADAIDYTRLRVDPGVWTQIEAQSWFNDGDPSDDGLRLMNLMATYYAGDASNAPLDVLGFYPRGIAADTEEALRRLRSTSLIRTIVAQPWLHDTIDDNERVLLGLLADAADHKTRVRTWPFDEVLIKATQASWFLDGLNEREIAMVGAATALSFRDSDRAAELMDAITTDSFLYESVSLPQSGEKTLVVTSGSQDIARRQASALALVKQWMVAVEDFAGPYVPRYVVISVEQIGNTLCGTARGQNQETPGIVTLNIDCVQDATVIHEVAHIFLGVGPTWFSEGVADLALFHVSGQTGSYLGQPALGKIELNGGGSATDADLSYYRSQGALGAKFLVDLYKMLGPQQMSAVVKEMSLVEWPRRGEWLLDALRASVPPDYRARVEALIADRFQ